jgi:hypothetical protein
MRQGLVECRDDQFIDGNGQVVNFHEKKEEEPDQAI